MIKIAFLTKTRDELVDVARTLARNLKQSALQDSAAPILWSNHGTVDSGKSLISDEATFELAGYPSSVLPAGKTLFTADILTEGELEFQYLDNDEPYELNNQHKYKIQREKLERKRQNRKQGGVLFVHNSPHVAKTEGAALDIYVGHRTHNINFILERGQSGLRQGLHDKLGRVDTIQNMFLMLFFCHEKHHARAV